MPIESPVVAEEEMIRRMQAGERSAWEAMLDRHASTFYGMALRLTRSREHAEALFLGTLDRFRRELPHYDRSNGRLFAYVSAIMHTIADDSGKSNRGSTAIKGFGLDAYAHGLAPDLHAAYTSRCVKGLSDAETAELLDIPVEKVKDRMRSAMKQLVNFARR